MSGTGVRVRKEAIELGRFPNPANRPDPHPTNPGHKCYRLDFNTQPLESLCDEVQNADLPQLSMDFEAW